MLLMQRNTIQLMQRNATQRNATQRNATQRNALHCNKQRNTTIYIAMLQRYYIYSNATI